MRIRATQSIRGYALFMIVTCMFSCDLFEGNDSIKPALTQTDYYILPGTSIIIDIASLTKQSYTDLSISISKNPGKGELTSVDALLFKYKPSSEFVDGKDQFVLTAMSNGKLLANQTVTIHLKKTKEEFPCTLIPVEDKIKFDTATSVLVPVLGNDWLCNADESNVSISIHSQPLYGTVAVEGEIVRYTIHGPVQGNDSFIYKLTMSNGNVSYGLVSLTIGTHSTALSLAVPQDDQLTDMVFLDEYIGFVVGTNIYKTTDGGQHWDQVHLPLNEFGYGLFMDINFLNENEGVALYVPCDPYLGVSDCGIGLLKTMDGGNSWKDIPIKLDGLDFGNSVFFTSSSTGFIGGVLINSYNNTAENQRVILKTDDDGATWRQVLVTKEVAEMAIKFADTQVGYAYPKYYANQMDKIFITEDGGELWKPFTTQNLISALDIVTTEEIFASWTTHDSQNGPSSIVRLNGTSGEDLVTNLPYKIAQLEFSPSGNTGIAGGISNTLVINKSVDRGATWTEEYIENIKKRDDNFHFNYFEAISVPSENVAYILYGGNILKYSIK